MALRFAVLSSGSSGNSALIRAVDGAGLLLDIGLGLKDLTRRMESLATRWSQIGAVVITHTHGDHVNPAVLARLLRDRIPLHCHEGQLPALRRFDVFPRLEAAGLVHPHDESPFLTQCGLQVEPIELSHDAGPTFGFRIEGRGSRRERPVAIGYVADTGIWHDRISEALLEVDLLGVEFNHDVELQRRSGRPYSHIARNLGRYGHLSNEQGADLVQEVLTRSGSAAPRQVVLLHLSLDCNAPELALEAARRAARAAGRRPTIHLASRFEPSPDLLVVPRRRSIRASHGLDPALLAPTLPF
ncbi:MAG: MBL fold metallo-hydrolase [Isosphaeraceae bacterium]|nr:MBL fold metallo-hydrolase [Isosphaeraceae bacterium]